MRYEVLSEFGDERLIGNEDGIQVQIEEGFVEEVDVPMGVRNSPFPVDSIDSDVDAGFDVEGPMQCPYIIYPM